MDKHADRDRGRARVDRQVAAMWLALVGCLASGARTEAPRVGTFVEPLGAPRAAVTKPNPRVTYDLAMDQERYLVHVPANYSGAEPFGVLVFVHAGDEVDSVPGDWAPVLARHKLLLVAPQQAGNNHPTARRCGLAVLGAMRVAERYKVDPRRVYAAGFSGGARVAGQLGYRQPDVFRGTVQVCGADFHEPVAAVHAKPAPGRPDGAYGLIAATAEEAAAARAGVRFVLVTGSGDFRHGDLLDLYHGGFAKAGAGFQAKLIDVPGMGHTLCGGATLAAALAFLDGGAAAASTGAPPATTRPAWVAREPGRWPVILLANDGRLKPNVAVRGASGFLVRLPNGAVVAATAKHVAGKDADVAQLRASLQSWAMHPRTMPQRRVTLAKLAMRADVPADLDLLVFHAPPSANWPAEVLTPRPVPVEPGEAVYLVAIPYEQDGVQNVYPGVVRRRSQDPREFAYEFAADVKTAGFSGAPILDADGNLAGVHLGKFDAETGGGKVMGSGLDAAAVVEFADAPAPPPVRVAAAAAGADRPATGPVAQAAGADDTAGKADRALQMARNYVNAKRYDVARARLKEVAERYPGTPAAREAGQLLKEVETK